MFIVTPVNRTERPNGHANPHSLEDLEMLNEVELQKVAEMIPAKTPYAVIASWADVDGIED